MKRIATLVAVFAVSASYAYAKPAPVVIGAVYPLQGGQGPGGVEEYRGARLAVELANRRGGLNGRPFELRLAQADSFDQAPRAVRALAADGIQVVLGSHGSTISSPAADAAARNRMVFWETGAVGELMGAGARGPMVFRFAPTGAHLGREAAAFAREVLLPKLGHRAQALRYAVTYVDDEYGRAVGLGAAAEVERSGLPLAGVFPYQLRPGEEARVVREAIAARTDVLFVAAYLDDGVELRRQQVRQRMPLVASVGTSSSYCMHAFGEALGDDAVGLYASDKPDGDVLDPAKLSPGVGEVLRWARATYERRFDHGMPAGALTGFAGTWALLREVLPRAASLAAADVAAAARAVRLPQGALPNGSGLEFGPADGEDPSENLAAASVIWEWVAPRTRAIVWPPAFATQDLVPLSIR